MNIRSTLQTLKAMHFSAMAAEYEKQLSDPQAFSKMSFDDRVALLVDTKMARLSRQKNEYC